MIFEPGKPINSWSPVMQAVWGKSLNVPLLRTWDYFSGSKPDVETGHMYARDREMPLNTFESRKCSLQKHITHSIWEDTPYISFTSSWQTLADIANNRKCKRGNQTITVIDPTVRLEAGLPVVCFGDESKYYGVKNPYNSISDEELSNHYVCLWRVEAEEIVGHLDWDELSRDPDWYRNVIIPKLVEFREHRQQRQLNAVNDHIDDLSVDIGALSLNGSTSDSSSSHDSSDSEDPR
ncbi:hypothetical protein FHETE_9287 [Fusarium heterosporum]|uniref:DUF7587 domain-containing protein n=1 Tax=Fusarium heterosporum TaxID=42747 RepID=A0A8H5SYX8_FUSHE|nr:hypothetical protein FHETE_9287 [Fusarium heterosporum]